MILVSCSPVINSSLLPAKFSGSFSKSDFSPSNSNSLCDISIFPSKFGSKESSFQCSCTKKEENANISENFSVLSSEVPWDGGSIWSTMGFYIFSLHIPLSFGGLSVIAQVMHQPVLDPQTQAVSMLLIQTLEILGTLILLRYTANPQYKIGSFLQSNNFSKQRNWFLASTLGFGFLITVVLVTSFLAGGSVGPKVMNNPVVQEILSSGPISISACFLAYCFTTPLLEEIVYRGFLLGSLASTMKWQQAVILSSCIFSLAHFSSENFLQLFFIGCVLGCSYCWSGNLTSSVSIHALYNAVTLISTILS